MKSKAHCFTGEDGYTLVEVVVATALLVSVLFPLGGAAIYLLKVRQNERHVLALAYGQDMMEATLHQEAYTNQVVVLEEGRWRVDRTIRRRDKQVVIRVDVFRRGHSEPIVRLMTLRLIR